MVSVEHTHEGELARSTSRPVGPPAGVDVTTTWIGQLVAEDGSTLANAATRSAFLDHLKVELEAMVDAEMAGTGWSGANCPWIAFYTERYRSSPLTSWQRLAELWLPGPQPVDAGGFRRRIVEQARTGVRRWQAGGSPLPPSPIDAGENMPSILRWAMPGAGPIDPQAARLAYRLGPGDLLPAGVASRFATEIGSAPMHAQVRLHRGAAADRAAGAIGARAFTMGNVIAFGAGEFAPGTPAGDALLAHELYHATAGGGVNEPVEERAADAAARRAVSRLWGGADRTAPEPAPPGTSGRAGRGLVLRRCGDWEPGDSRPEPEVVPEEDMAARGFALQPPTGEPVVGRSYTLQLTTPATIRAAGSPAPYGFTRWFVGPGGGDLRRRPDIGLSHTETLDERGVLTIVAVVSLGPNVQGRLWHRVTVVTAREVAGQRLSDVRSTDLVGFHAALEYQRLQLGHLGLVEQTDAPTHITVEGPNPAEVAFNFPYTPVNRYTVHTPPGVTPHRYRWLGGPQDLRGYPTRERFGQRRATIEGIDGFDLGTSRQAHWNLGMEAGVILIHCFVYDATGHELGHARYRQVVLTEAERKTLGRFSGYVTEARAELRKLREETATFVPAVHVANETGAVAEVSIFMGRSASSGSFLLLDVTPGVKRREYEGTDFTDALGTLNEGNSYPDGILRLRVEANSLGVPAAEWSLTTTGESLAEQLSSTTGWASLGLAGLGALSLVIPGAQPLAPVFFLASGAAGAVSAGAGLYQLSQEVHPSGLSVAINVVSLAGSLIGMAGAANILRHGSRLAALTKTGRFVLFTGFATDALGGVLLAADSIGQITEILEGPGRAEEKAAALVRILAGLLLNGALLAWGARDLTATRRQVEQALGADVARELALADVHALSVLEPSSLGRLAGATTDEIKAAAAVIRSDPVRATQLAERFGEQFVVAARGGPASLEELEQALVLGIPEAAGTRGSYGPDPGPTGTRPAYIEQPGRGDASPNNLWEKIRASFINTQSRPLREKARLHAIGTVQRGTAHTRFELRIPADGARAEQVITVRIESTRVRPTSLHRDETGPARMLVRSTPAGGYAVAIEVHADLDWDQIANAVGHELDEAIGIALRGVRGDDITAQKRASLLRAHSDTSAPPPPATAHDEASARELAHAAPPLSQRPPDGSLPPDLRSRALEMGLGNTVNLEDKLALLARHGVDGDMVRRLRTLAHLSDIARLTPQPTTFMTPRIVSHLLHASRGSPASPIGGAHLEAQLQAQTSTLGTSTSPVRLVPANDPVLSCGGVEYRAHEQWKWDLGGSGPPSGSAPPATAGGPAMVGQRVGGWRLAAEPKTTFDNLAAFLLRAEDAWGQWSNSATGKTAIAGGGSNLIWEFTLPTGETIAGRFNITSGGVEHISVYPYRRNGLTTW